VFSRARTYVMLVIIAAIFIVPFLIVLSTALKPSSQPVYSFPPDLIPRPPVFDWFVEAWTRVPFPQYMLNSLIYTAVGVPLYVAVAALTAYPLASMRFRGRLIVFGLFVSTMFLPGEVMLIPRFLVVSQLGMVNTYQGALLPTILSGFVILLLTRAFAAVPGELYEASRLDGCGWWGQFWHVGLPVVRPTLAITAIFGFISIYNDFLWPMVVLSDDSKYPLALGLAYLSGTAGTDVRTPAAGAIISLVPILIFFLLLQRQILNNAAGALKD
jgi:putative chitobiose transport system permease protein